MEGKKFSLNNIITNSIVQMKGKCRKIFAVSIMQYMTFLLPYLFTRSLLISFAVYVLFMPGIIKFLGNMESFKAEDAFKFNKTFVTQLLISLLFVLVFGVGSVLLIFPGVMFFTNYALVFDEAKNGDKDVLGAYKAAKENTKGYRGKMALLCLAFMLILILLVGLGILISWLFSLFIPALTYSYGFIWSFLLLPMFYYVGTILGVSVFMIFVLPVELLAISNMKGAIAQDKLYRSAIEQEKDQQNNVDAEKNKELPEEKENKQEEKDGDEPADYIF